MRIRQVTPRMVVSMIVASAVVAAYSIGSLAAPSASASSNAPAVQSQQDQPPATPPAGAHLISVGLITINGHPAKNGTTVVPGTTIASGSDGRAVIDLGALGKIRVEPNSSFNLNFTPDKFQIKLVCSSARVTVTAGQIEFTPASPPPKKVGDYYEVDQRVEISGSGGADLTIDCSDESPKGGGYIGPGTLGVLGLIGTASGIAAGIIIGGGNPPPRTSLSPFIP